MSSDPLVNQHYAYPDPQVEAIMRLSAVKRWHMIDTTRTQTLAEHSANVAGLAYLLAQSAPAAYFGDAAHVGIYGLLHDLSEVFIGDIPTHSKRWLNKEDLEKAEQAVTPKIFTRPTPDKHVKLLVKICDLVDGIRFIRIHGADSTSRHAQLGLEQQLIQRLGDTRDWPSEVFEHVFNTARFYAYEGGKPATRGLEEDYGWRVAVHVARRSGDKPGGSGPVVRDVRGGV